MRSFLDVSGWRGARCPLCRRGVFPGLRSAQVAIDLTGAASSGLGSADDDVPPLDVPAGVPLQ
eukprot:654489-Pyramimonas_sp.AAC.1